MKIAKSIIGLIGLIAFTWGLWQLPMWQLKFLAAMIVTFICVIFIVSDDEDEAKDKK